MGHGGLHRLRPASLFPPWPARSPSKCPKALSSRQIYTDSLASRRGFGPALLALSPLVVPRGPSNPERSLARQSASLGSALSRFGTPVDRSG